MVRVGRPYEDISRTTVLFRDSASRDLGDLWVGFVCGDVLARIARALWGSLSSDVFSELL